MSLQDEAGSNEDRFRRDAGGPGGIISIVGPDGAGKSTLIDALVAETLAGAPVLNIRYPRVLPRRMAEDGAPVTEPHRAPVYPLWLSLAKTAYVFIDYLLGWNLRVKPWARRGGWVIIQRGWWDMAVDPRRYRLSVPARLMWSLGRLLPAADLLLILEAPPDVVYARKTELSLAELERQMLEWRRHLPGGQRHLFLDATLPAAEVARLARDEVTRMAGGTRGAGTANLPHRDDPRWLLPRGPRRVAVGAVRVYHPITPVGLAGWSAARLAAGAGGFRLLPQGRDAPASIRALLGPHIPPGSHLAVARANNPGRCVVLVLDHGGRPLAVAKVATDESDERFLVKEVANIRTLASLLQAPLAAPHVLAHGKGFVLLEDVAWRPRLRPWKLPVEVAAALGAFWTAGGAAHGDFAPWNLLRTRSGWAVLDWEEARTGTPPGSDLWHYIVQGHALLRRPSEGALLAGLEGRGWIGAAVSAYAGAAGLEPVEARGWLAGYLEASIPTLDPATTEGMAGLEARRGLRAKI